jgi:hypothetical protein
LKLVSGGVDGILIHLSNYTEQKNLKKLKTFDNIPTMKICSKSDKLMLIQNNDNQLYLLKSPEVSISLEKKTSSIGSNPLMLATFEPKVFLTFEFTKLESKWLENVRF